MTSKRATENELDELHGFIAKRIAYLISNSKDPLDELKAIKAGMDFLKMNNITGVAIEGNAVDELKKLIEGSDLLSKIDNSKGITAPKLLN